MTNVWYRGRALLGTVTIAAGMVGSACATAAQDASQSVADSPRLSSIDMGDRNILLAGYAVAGLAISEDGSSFDAAFNPALHFQFRDFVMLDSELEIFVSDDGETELELEFAQIDLLIHDNITLVAGKFLSPVGQFRERLHPSWINRLADAPAGFGHDGLAPTAEVGLQVRGGVALGEGTRLGYAVAIGNGPRLDEEAAVMQEGFGSDDNDNKAISGRVALLPVPYVEVGASFLRAKVQPMDEVSPQADFDLWGLDGAYTDGPWDVRVEYLRGTRDRVEMGMDVFPRLEMDAWYAQAAYRLSGVTQDPILQNLEPVVRYGEYKIEGLDELEEEAEEERLDVGINYWFAPSIVLHTAYQNRNFTGRAAGEDRKDSRLLLQLGYGF